MHICDAKMCHDILAMKQRTNQYYMRIVVKCVVIESVYLNKCSYELTVYIAILQNNTWYFGSDIIRGSLFFYFHTNKLPLRSHLRSHFHTHYTHTVLSDCVSLRVIKRYHEKHKSTKYLFITIYIIASDLIRDAIS